ncbi:hypothetical protein SPH9361_00550 [Sphingobium sp. CECT 9361]|nr:hypothetical protein SPH9361_00550 [Sphingobium sp. CECT 9361]
MESRCIYAPLFTGSMIFFVDYHNIYGVEQMSITASGFEYSEWRIALPVDAAGKTTGNAAQIDKLAGYGGSEYFRPSDTALVFRAAVDGATTSGSKYARSELRELTNGNSAAWNLKQGGTMTATLSVDSVPTYFNGTPGRLVIGQIHGKENELVRLYWDNGTVYFVNDLAGPSNKELKFQLLSPNNETPSIDLGEAFSYKINAVGNTLEVVVYADGQTYSSTTQINAIWQSDSLYFKAGVYLGVNETQGTGVGQTSFFGLDIAHTQGDGLGGLGAPSGPGGPDGSGGPGDPDTPVETGNVLMGTAGDDQFDVTASTDIIREAANGGIDTATAHVDYTLGDNVENLILADGATTGTGNGLANDITGTDGNNSLYGMAGNDRLYGLAGNDVLDGGTGADVLTGGEGNDSYYVDNVGDSVVETSYLHGTDTVYSSVHFTLSDFVENATAQGTANINLTGNSKANVLTGNAGNNILDGGASTDTMIGGAGDDTYYVSTSKDVVVEAAKGGNDLVISSSGYTLADNVERLLLAGTTSSGTGNSLDNEITGNASANKLSGMAGNDKIHGLNGDDKIDGGDGNDWLFGGAGVDQLTGGSGKDYFVFNTLTTSADKDRVVDFKAVDDTFAFDNAVFTGLGADGQINSDLFVVGKAALDANDRLIYGSKSGVLSYDADGSGSGAAVQIATLSSGLHLTSSDFLII